MKKSIIASFVFFALTGSAWACGEIPDVQASVKADEKASKKVVQAAITPEDKVADKSAVKESDAPDEKAD